LETGENEDILGVFKLKFVCWEFVRVCLPFAGQKLFAEFLF